jgi:hypothetical protein
MRKWEVMGLFTGVCVCVCVCVAYCMRVLLKPTLHMIAFQCSAVSVALHINHSDSSTGKRWINGFKVTGKRQWKANGDRLKIGTVTSKLSSQYVLSWILYKVACFLSVYTECRIIVIVTFKHSIEYGGFIFGDLHCRVFSVKHALSFQLCIYQSVKLFVFM